MFSIEQSYLITLIRSALRGGEGVVAPEGLNYIKLYNLACSQSVMQMIYLPLTVKNVLPSTIVNYYEEAYGKAMAKSVNQDIEVNIIMEELERAGVKHMPLKGFVIKRLYPTPLMRTSCDVDILYDSTCYEKMNSVLLQCGYFQNSKGGNHDVYYKQPIMNIEMHNALFNLENKYSVLFSDIWDRVVLCGGKEYEYRMTVDDFYLHLITHSAKHFDNSGTGIRSVMDLYLFLKKYRNELDRKYINNNLDIVGLRKFAENFEYVSNVLFDTFDDINTINDETVEVIAKYLLSFGSYGSAKNHLASKINKNDNSKIKIIAKIVFLNYQDMSKTYKWLKGRKYLLPLAWIVRAFIVIFTRPANIRKSIKPITDLNKAYIENYQNVRKISGII